MINQHKINFKHIHNLPNQKVVLEACVESFRQAINAEKQGAGLIELCDRLDLGGVTPSEELIRSVKNRLVIPTRVMIRPRGGDFIYSSRELEEMCQSILL